MLEHRLKQSLQLPRLRFPPRESQIHFKRVSEPQVGSDEAKRDADEASALKLRAVPQEDSALDTPRQGPPASALFISSVYFIHVSSDSASSFTREEQKNPR